MSTTKTAATTDTQRSTDSPDDYGLGLPPVDHDYVNPPTRRADVETGGSTAWFGSTRRNVAGDRREHISYDEGSWADVDTLGSMWKRADEPLTYWRNWYRLGRVQSGAIDFGDDGESDARIDINEERRRHVIEAVLSDVEFPEWVQIRVVDVADDIDGSPWSRHYGGVTGLAVSLALVTMNDDPDDVTDEWRDAIVESIGNRFSDMGTIDSLVGLAFDRLE